MPNICVTDHFPYSYSKYATYSYSLGSVTSAALCWVASCFNQMVLIKGNKPRCPNLKERRHMPAAPPNTLLVEDQYVKTCICFFLYLSNKNCCILLTRPEQLVILDARAVSIKDLPSLPRPFFQSSFTSFCQSHR